MTDKNQEKTNNNLENRNEQHKLYLSLALKASGFYIIILGLFYLYYYF